MTVNCIGDTQQAYYGRKSHGEDCFHSKGNWICTVVFVGVEYKSLEKNWFLLRSGWVDGLSWLGVCTFLTHLNNQMLVLFN